MDVSLDWVRDYVDLRDVPLEDISRALRLSGLGLGPHYRDQDHPAKDARIGRLVDIEARISRHDWLGVIGIARELASRLSIPWMWREPRPIRDPHLTTHKDLKIIIGNDEDCHRLAALSMADVTLLPSPHWLQKRLLSSGIKPANLIVDAANFVMLEYHQSVHVYDERRLRGMTLQVTRAAATQIMTSLDGNKSQIDVGDLLIVDAAGTLSLAGILTDETASIDHTTNRIVIVCASFSPTLLSKTARRLGLTTEDTCRLACGTDLTMVPYAALRVAELISQGIHEAQHQNPHLREARVSKDMVDLGVRPSSPRLIAMRLSHGREFLGMGDLTRSKVTEALTGFSFRFVDGTEDRLVFEIPSFRPDIEREIDLIAELSRILGFDQVPPRPLPRAGKASR